MKKKQPETIAEQLDAKDLKDIETNSLDLRKDLHEFIGYVSKRLVKRSVRENKIPKMDAKRLAKLMSDPFAVEEVEDYGRSDWLDFIDSLALKMGLVDYDTKGKYAGYTSHSPSFFDNYIDFNEKKYRAFIKKTFQQQEQAIFDAMMNEYDGCNNELIVWNILGRLDKFDYSGCGTGILPYIKFDEVRKVLFNCLKNYQPGVWYSTPSLIRHLKKRHPYFLIPKKPKYKHQYDKKRGRYCNFTESGMGWGENISEKDPDAFERVEGRYVERFLEYIPLVMGYVELAYGVKNNLGDTPSIGQLKGFKLTEPFFQFMEGRILEPRVTVQPNHEIHIESAIYPAGMIEKLTPFATLVSVDKICIMKLERQMTIDYLAENDGFDVKAFLGRISAAPLPPNIATELEEWAGQSDTFILYESCGLLEGQRFPSFVKEFTIDSPSKKLRLVRSPDSVLEKLEKAGQAPVFLDHPKGGFLTPPEGVTSALIKKKAKKKAAAKKQITLKRRTLVSLSFPNADILEKCVKALVKEKCPVEVNQKALALSYALEDRKKVTAAMKTLKKDYRIKIEDTAS